MQRLVLFIFLFAPYWCAESNGLLVVAPTAQLKGVDVSHHQKQIEWDSVQAKEPIDFAFVKATEGGDYRDSLFCRNWDALGRLGIKRGAYHFFRGYGCGYEQAAHFLREVDLREGDLPPVLDVETLDGTHPDALVPELHAWLNTIEMNLAVKPIIYSNQNFFDRYLAGKGFDKYPLWIARYSEDSPSLTGKNYWTFWQYTNKGCVEGISEKVDLNIFSGTPEMLEDLSYRKIAVP